MRNLLIVVVLMAGSCDRPLEFHRVAYPGFALDVPTGLGAPTGASYASGSADLKTFSLIVQVKWSTSALPDDKLMPAFLEAVRSAEPKAQISAPTRATIAGLEAVRFDGIRGERAPADDFWSIVMVGCGIRTIHIMVHALRGGDAILARMLDHLECHPIASEEARIAASAPVGLDDRARIAGWKHLTAKGQYTITDQGENRIASFTVFAGDERLAFETLGKLSPWTLGPRTTVDGKTWVDIATTDAGNGAATTWACEPKTVLGFALGFERSADARAFLSGFRCARADDPPLIAP